MNNLKDSLHPTYKELSEQWKRCKLAYYGGRPYVEEVLIRHTREKQKPFADRLQRATLLNYFRPICDTYSNYLFRPQWELTGLGKVANLEQDCDHHGRPLIEFFKGAFPLAAAIGYIGIGVDAPVAPEGEPKTKADQDALGVRPYMYLIDPLDMLHWQTDEDGNLTMCLLRETSWETVVLDNDIKTAKKTIYRLWTKEFCKVYTEKGDLLNEYINRIGVVPITTLKFRDIGDPIVGQGLGQDLEPVQAKLLNKGSWLDNIHAGQTFSQLMAFGSPEEYSEDGNLAALGTSSIFLVPADGRPGANYISPDASQAQLLSLECNNLVDEMYRLANLVKGSVREGAMQSGISKAFDFLDTNQALADAGRNIAVCMKKALQFAALLAGGDPEAIEVVQPSDYGVIDVNTDIANLALLKNAGASNALLIEMEKKIAKALFPGTDDELANKIEEEANNADKWTTPEQPNFGPEVIA
jgi:hypothetical protein